MRVQSRVDAAGTLLLLLVADTGVSGQAVSLSGPLEPGPYAVGFSAVSAAGTSEGPNDGEGASRPLRLMMWYPARIGTGRPMRFGDYLDPSVRGDPLPEAYLTYLEDRDRDVGRRQFSPASDSLLELLSAVPVGGRMDASPAPGRHPLVLHSLGRNDWQQESVPLWEYVASHGYVVVVVPQLGRSLEAAGLAFVADDQRLQARDLSAALAAVAPVPWIDRSRIAVLGHSSGGVSGLFLAESHPEVDLIVGLDASFATEDGYALLGDAEWSPDRIGAWVIDIYAAGKSVRDSRQINRVAGPVCAVGIGGPAPPTLALHPDFQGWPAYTRAVGFDDPRAGGARPADLAARFYWATAWIVRSALDTRFGRAGDALELDPPMLDGGLVRAEGVCRLGA
jgi:hypothetical protein